MMKRELTLTDIAGYLDHPLATSYGRNLLDRR